VHALFAVHVLHWKLKGRTLAPLEFSESLHTIHDGIITVGFFFAAAAILGTLFFGRFFCGWGCHILALQDLCAWILSKFGIRPKPVRSRVMAWIPFGILAYLYLWPQWLRILAGRAQPPLLAQQDLDGWASYATRDLFRAMPGVTFAVVTFLVCGFLIVYFLGSRSFCYSVCPYGVFFGWAEKLAPGGRLVLSGSCENCGLCTLNCKSGVKVIQELKQHGTVVDTNCLKSLDCVAGCPSDAIGIGFKTPAFFSKKEKPIRKKKIFDFRLYEEVVFSALFILLFLVYRGLYEIGIFLAAAIAVIGGVHALKLWQTMRLKSRPAGFPYRLGGGIGFAAFTLYCAFVHYQVHAGETSFSRKEAPAECAAHLQAAEEWGLFGDPEAERELALTYGAMNDFDKSRIFFGKYLKRRGYEVATKVQYGKLLAAAGHEDEAFQQYLSALIPDSLLRSRADKGWRAAAHSLAARHLVSQGDTALGLEHLRNAIDDNPQDVSNYCNYGSLCIRRGDYRGARDILAEGRKNLGPSDCLQGLLRVAEKAEAIK
jgi:tetratricopeptide (TPR) repeat protein/ferredoxin